MDRREIYSLTGSIVRIAAPDDGAVLLFSVESAAGTMAVLRPCNSASKEFAMGLAPGDELLLTAGAFDGVLHGRLRVERWSPAQRMLMVDNPPLEYTQRRESYRVAASIPVVAVVTDPSLPERARMVRGTTHDLSQGGCAITLPGEALVAGRELLAVLTTQRQPIMSVVTVLGPHPDVRHTWRCRFDQLTPLDQTVLAAELRRLEVAKASAGRAPVSAGSGVR